MSGKKVVGILLLWFSCLGFASPQEPVARLSSLIRVIAAPKNFDGHKLRLVGYLANNGPDRAIGVYINEMDGRNFILSNSVDVLTEASRVEELLGKYVVLEGTFHAPKGRWVDYTNGYLDHVSVIKLWAQGDVPK